MIVRSATVEDADQISALIVSHQRLLTSHPDARGAEGFLTSIASPAICDLIKSSRFSCLVAENDGQIVAVAALRDNAHVYHLFVSSSEQGKGIARHLWDIVRADAITNGNPGQFTVNSSPNAVPVYERFGFKQCAPRVETNGVAFIPMRLEATPASS